ncbi:MAG: zinc-dependent metalloprotease [Bacteroides sp.]|nr:zinc-dependent metalloprotease [Bacteroides sp.]
MNILGLRQIALIVLSVVFTIDGLAISNSTLLLSPSKKEETKYSKLFKGKRVETVKSRFMTLHKLDSKLFIELPLKYLDEEMLIGATVSSVSDPTYVSVGMKNSDPLHVKFMVQDSAVVVKKINTLVYDDLANKPLTDAFELNYRDPLITSFPISAYTPDSLSVVFDATSLLAKPNSLIKIIPEEKGSMNITASAKPEFSFIKSLKAFDDNISVKSEFTYNVSATIMRIVNVANNIPTTIEVTHSILLLPKEVMTPRFADSRVGIFSSNKMSFDGSKDKSGKKHFAHRWNLVPSDEQAFIVGELSTPIKPICFYLDNTFPHIWREAIREGVLRWNSAFEKIGFKEAIQVKDFPTDDESFDPDNLKYSCIRYIPNAEENAMGPSWVDPRSGEIINASVIVYNNVERLLHKWRFVQTANVDERVRSNKLPDDVLKESIAYVISHEIGHTLGLMHNMSASYHFPTDSLRSSTFTQKYGTTPSIMDYARFNYIAQPQDKGVRLTPPNIGVYDYHAIEWNYKYFPSLKGKPAEQAKVLEAMVDERVKNPMLRYGAQQTFVLDPSAISEDLGNDPIKSSNYGIKNLQGINKGLYDWITDDEDTRKKSALDLAIAQQYYAYLKNVMYLVGGIYMNDAKENSGIARQTIVPKKKQREALLWSIDQAKKFKSYSNSRLEKNKFLSISYYDQLLEFITNDILNLRARILVASNISDNTYSMKEYFNDVYTQFFKSVIQGTKPNNAEKIMQKTFVELGSMSVTTGKAPISLPFQLADGKSLAEVYFGLTEKYGSLPNDLVDKLKVSAYGDPSKTIYPKVNLEQMDNSSIYFYDALMKLKPLLIIRVKSTTDVDLKAHYQSLLYKVNKALRIKS